MSQEPLTASERASIIEYMITRRTSAFTYLKKVYEGSVPWLNCVQLSEDLLGPVYGGKENQRRVQQWFVFGASASNLLHLADGVEFVRALSQLTEEFDYYCGNAASQGMKLLKAAVSSTEPEDPYAIRPMIKQTGTNKVQYQYLKPLNIPFQVHYREVLYSLCDILGLLYRKFMNEESSAEPSLFDAIIKLDKRFKHHIIGPISRDLSTIAQTVVKNELLSLVPSTDSDPAFGTYTSDESSEVTK